MKKYKFLFVISTLAIITMLFLGANINTKREEKKQLTSQNSPIHDPMKNSSWKEKYPRQYETWVSAKDSSVWEDEIEQKPSLAIVGAGSGGPTGPRLLGIRSHYYSIVDFLTMADSGIPNKHGEDKTTTRCLLCHSSATPELMKRDGEVNFLTSTWTKYGSEALNPIGCANCHDPETMKLRVSLAWVNRGLLDAGKPAFENQPHQEKRNLVCAQCHLKIYTEQVPIMNENGKEVIARISNPLWKNGFTLDNMEDFYNNGKNFRSGKPYYDWINPLSKTPIISANYPEYELFKQGTHGKNNVACADCHMPYKQDGGVKFTDHKVGNPLTAIDRTCQTCHRKSEADLRNAVLEKKQRKDALANTALENIALAHLEAKKAWESGATEAEMSSVLADIRSAQFKWNSLYRGAYFHAPEQTLSALGDSINKAQRARLNIASILAKHGVTNYIAPIYSSKKEAFALLSLPQKDEAIEAKCESIEQIVAEWGKISKEKDTYDKDIVYPPNLNTWHTKECNKPLHLFN